MTIEKDSSIGDQLGIVIPGRATQIGCCRSAHSTMLISGKPEISGASPESITPDRAYRSPLWLWIPGSPLARRPGMTASIDSASAARPLATRLLRSLWSDARHLQIIALASLLAI